MRNKKPPFEITNTMIHEIAEIAELVGKLISTNQLSANPTLRRTNRIRTIHGSLARRFWLRAKILPRLKMPMRSMSDWRSLTPTLWMTC